MLHHASYPSSIDGNSSSNTALAFTQRNTFINPILDPKIPSYKLSANVNVKTGDTPSSSREQSFFARESEVKFENEDDFEEYYVMQNEVRLTIRQLFCVCQVINVYTFHQS